MADDLRKALKTETDDGVKKALSKAIESVDPPLDKLHYFELIRRVHNTREDLPMRQAAIKALTHIRFVDAYRGIRESLQNVLLDPAIQSEVADALETLEKREGKVLRDKNDVVIPKRGR